MMRYLNAALLALLVVLLFVCSAFAEAPRKPAYRADVVLFADAVYEVFDLRAKDVFVFRKPPPPPRPVLLGRDADGREVRAAPAPPPATPAPPPPSQAQPGEAGKDAPPKMRQADENAPALAKPAEAKAASPAALLSSLAPACASCHTRGKKVRGGFVLFDAAGRIDASVDWSEVRDVLRSGALTPMPPPDSDKPKPSSADLAEVRRLAK